MSDRTAIEWTDATWNPITGCSVVSAGCTHCYAMRLAGTRLRHHPSRIGLTRESAAGPVWTGEVRLNREWLDLPLRWSKPRRIFVCAHGDLFHEAVPDQWLDDIFQIMASAQRHTFQVLTKRSRRMRDYLLHRGFHRLGDECWTMTARIDPENPRAFSPAPTRQPLPNVWFGVSAENQVTFDERVQDLLATPAAVRWVSLEPLLSAINMRLMRVGDITRQDALTGRFDTGGLVPAAEPTAKLDWVVVGGESGPKARPLHPDWVHSLHDQCADEGVAFFFKQWGAWLPVMGHAHGAPVSAKRTLADGTVMGYAGKKSAGHLLNGNTHHAFPAIRQIRLK